MSKSLGNTILLADMPDDVQKKMRSAVTDTRKIRRNDPGRPEICTVFSYHAKFTPSEQRQTIEADCRSGALGCVECKKMCAANISGELAPLIEKRRYYESNPGLVLDILLDGEARARTIARHTMVEVREAMSLGRQYREKPSMDKMNHTE